MRYIGLVWMFLLFTSAMTCSGVSGEDEVVQVVDSRLSQKVTYRAAAKSVAGVLRDLSDMTGVTFRAGYNELDWQVRDRKMVIAVNDVRLADLMNSIARTMKFKWSRNTKAEPPTYRLYMDRTLLLEANRLLQEQMDLVRREIDEKRLQELPKLLELADATSEQLEEVKNKNPRMYLYARSGAAKSFSAFLNAEPDLHAALASGQEIDLSSSSLSPDGRQAMLQLMKDLTRPDGIDIIPRGNREPLPEDYASRVGGVKVRVNESLSKWLLNPFSRGLYLGGVSLECGGWSSGVGFINPDNSQLVIDKMRLKEAEGTPAKEAFEQYESEYRQARFAEKKNDPSGEPLIEHLEDPELDVEVKLDVKEQRLSDYQLVLADGSKFNVVSDWCGSWPESLDLPKTGATIRTVLDRIQDRCHYNWERHGRILEFRDRHWYWKRSAQIPEAWLEDWKKALRTTGTLDLDKLVQVSRLNGEQYQFNIPGDEMLAGDLARGLGSFADFGIYGPMLQVYGTLNGRERRMLFAGGIDVSSLSPEAKESMDTFLGRNNRTYLEDPRPNIRLTAARKKLGKQFEYVFTLTPDTDLKPVEIKFTTPKYEPKEAEPASVKGKK